MAKKFIGIDVGEKRIGLATATSDVGIAIPYDTVIVDGTEITQIQELIASEHAHAVVVGYPRNQSGEPTAQTRFVEDFVGSLGELDTDVVYQDESLTSVMAEERLKASGKTYKKGDIDAYAAAIILQDYLEERYGTI